MIGKLEQTDLSIRSLVRDREAALRYTLVLLQLGVLWWLVNQYAVEASIGLPRLFPFVVGGFIVHSLLPRTLRLPAFLLLGLVTIFGLLSSVGAAVLLGLFLLFFGILRLPISVNLRTVLMLGAGAALAYVWSQHRDWIPDGNVVVPIVGSIFMFRATVYLYDIRHEKKPEPLDRQLAYFFMLPNFILTLYPVVDYKVFNRSYYSKPALDIYQQGVRWMVRGFFHLMLYRIIYYYLQPSLSTVTDLGSLVLYAVTSYLLILRLSGLFHTSVGVLCLFGFNLPRVFHNYFLASGFSDLWRRINIYWRDYIVKVFYYPIYFKTRRIGNLPGMVVAILIVFGITWFLHSYQWFWLKGNFPVRLIDGLFWGIFGVLVAASSVYQQLVPKKKRFANRQSASVQMLLRSVHVTAMFSFMCLLWTFWNSPSLGQWWGLMSVAGTAGAAEWGALGLGILGLIALGWAGFWLFEQPKVKGFLEPDDSKSPAVFWSGLSLGLFALLTVPAVISPIQHFVEKPVTDIYESKLNTDDASLEIDAYYEDILVTNQLTSQVMTNFDRPREWKAFTQTEACVLTHNWLHHDLVPNVSTIFKDASLQTNSWAMRDKEYTLEKPADTFRMGILGGSYVMGSGVANEQVFEAICEEQLNRKKLYGSNYELLNFSVPGYHLMHLSHLFENRALNFELDAALFVSQGVDFEKVLKSIRKGRNHDDAIDLPYLRPILDRWGFLPGTTPQLGHQEQPQLAREVVRTCLMHVGELCRERGIAPIMMHWPRTRKESDSEEIEELFAMAREAGFYILDLDDVYDEVAMQEITLTEFDQHPNELGHRLVAEGLLERFRNDEKLRALVLETVNQ